MTTAAGMHCKVMPKECCGPQTCCGGALGVEGGGPHPYCYHWPVDQGMKFEVSEEDGHEWRGNLGYVSQMSAIQAMKYGCLHPNCICPGEIADGKCYHKLSVSGGSGSDIWLHSIQNASDCQKQGTCYLDGLPVKISKEECEDCRDGGWSTEWVPGNFHDECVNCDPGAVSADIAKDCLTAPVPSDEEGNRCCADTDVPLCATCPHTCNVFAGGTDEFCGPPVLYSTQGPMGNGIGIVIPWHISLACVRPGPVDGHAYPEPDYGVWVATVTGYRPDCEHIMGEVECFNKQYIGVGNGVDAKDYKLLGSVGEIDDSDPDNPVFIPAVDLSGDVLGDHKMEIVSCGGGGKLEFLIEIEDFEENSCQFTCSCKCPCDQQVTNVGAEATCDCHPDDGGENPDCPNGPEHEPCVQDSTDPPECDAACWQTKGLCKALEAERENQTLAYLSENYCLGDCPDGSAAGGGGGDGQGGGSGLPGQPGSGGSAPGGGGDDDDDDGVLSCGLDEDGNELKPELKGGALNCDGTVCCEVCNPYCGDSCVCEEKSCLTGDPEPCNSSTTFYNSGGHGAADPDQYSPQRETIECPCGGDSNTQAYSDPCKDRCKFNCGCMKNNVPGKITIRITADLPEVAGCDLAKKSPENFGCSHTVYPQDCKGPLPGPFYAEGVRCANPWDLTPGREGSVYMQPQWGSQCVLPGGSSNGPDSWDFPAKAGGCLGCSPHHFGKFPWHDPDGDCCIKHPDYIDVIPEHGSIGECNPYCEGWWETVHDCLRAYQLGVCQCRDVSGHDDCLPCWSECYEELYAAGVVTKPEEFSGGVLTFTGCHPEDRGSSDGCEGKWPGFFPFLYYHPPESEYCPYGEYFPANGCPPVENSPRAKKFGGAQLYYPGNMNTKWSSCCGNQPAGCKCVYPCGHPAYDPWARTEALVAGSICDVCWECMATAKLGRPNSSLDETAGPLVGCPDGCEASGAGSGQCVQVVQDGGNEIAGCGQFMQESPDCPHPRYCPEGMIPYSTAGGGYCIEGMPCCTCCPGSYRDPASGAPIELMNWEKLCSAVCDLEPCGMGGGGHSGSTGGGDDPGLGGIIGKDLGGDAEVFGPLATVTFMRDGTSTPFGPVVRLEDKMDRYEIVAMTADPHGSAIISIKLQESQTAHTLATGDEIWLGAFPMEDGTKIGSDVEPPVDDMNGLWVVDLGSAAEVNTGVIDPTRQLFIKYIGGSRKSLTGSWNTGGTIFPWKESDSDYNSVHVDGSGEVATPSNTPGDGSSINIYSKTKPGYINTDLFIGLVEEAFGEWSRILDKLFSTDSTAVFGQQIAFSHDMATRFINMGFENPESKDVPSKEGEIYNVPEWGEYFDAPEFGKCTDHQGNPVDVDTQSECLPYGGCYKVGCSANDKRTFVGLPITAHNIEYPDYKSCVEASVSYCLKTDSLSNTTYIDHTIVDERRCAGDWITKKGEWSIEFGNGSGVFHAAPSFVYPCVPKSGEDTSCRSCEVGIHIDCNVCVQTGWTNSQATPPAFVPADRNLVDALGETLSTVITDAPNKAACEALSGGEWTMLPQATNSYVPSTCCEQMEDIYGQCAGDYNMDGDIDLLNLPGDQCNTDESGWCVDRNNFNNVHYNSESCPTCGGKKQCELGSTGVGECTTTYTVGGVSKGFSTGELTKVLETVLVAQLSTTDTTVNVDSVAAFSDGDWIYIGQPTSGPEEMLVTSIDTAANRLSVDRPTLLDLRDEHPVGDYVYINTISSETGCNNSGYCLGKKDAYVGAGPCLVCNDESGYAYSRPFNKRTNNFVTMTLWQSMPFSPLTTGSDDVNIILENFIEPGDATLTPIFEVGDYFSICTEVFRIISLTDHQGNLLPTPNGSPPTARAAVVRRGRRNSERPAHDAGDFVREEYASHCSQAECTAVTGTAASWKPFSYNELSPGWAAGEWRRAAWKPSFKWHFNQWVTNSSINKAYYGKTGPQCENFPEEGECCPRTGSIRVGMVNIDNCRDGACGNCWNTLNHPPTILKGICTRTTEGPAGTVLVTEDHDANKSDYDCVQNTPASQTCDGCIDKNCYHSSSGTVDCYSGVCVDGNNVVELYEDGNNHKQRMTQFACVNSASIGLGSQYQWVEYSWKPWTKDSCGDYDDYKWEIPKLLPYLASGDFFGCHLHDGDAACFKQDENGKWVGCMPGRAYNRGYNPLSVMDENPPNDDSAHCCDRDDLGSYCDGFISTRRDLGTGGADTDWIRDGGDPPDNNAPDVDQSPCICFENGRNAIGGDLYINSLIDWRPDYIPESVDVGAYSIKRTVMHEIGHLLGLSDKNDGGSKDIMTPIHGPDDSFNDISSYADTKEQLIQLYDKKWWDRGGLAEYFPASGVYCGRF
tara:strand:+ start:33094 stop:40137 length:7044 start_codon:yes stop_codon:yes gene_type:complete